MSKFFSLLFFCFFLASVSIDIKAQTLEVDTSFCETDGDVNALLYDSLTNTIYIGGSFRRVGTTLALDGVPVNLNTARSIPLFDRPNGAVNSVISDGNNGWFIGGSFNAVGDSARGSIAHLNSNGKVTSLFSKNGFDGEVKSLAILDSVLYAGGRFRNYGTLSSRANGAIIDTTISATYQTPPSLNVKGTVFSSVADGTGGWYIGGTFASIGDSSRNNIAHINSFGQVTSKLSNAGFNGTVTSLLLKDSILFVGGNFKSFGSNKTIGFRKIFNNIELPYESGLILDSSLSESSLKKVDAIDIDNVISDGKSGFYISGSFELIGDSIRKNLAHIDSNGVATNWNPNIDGTIQSMVLKDTILYICGSFKFIGNKVRNKLGAINTNTGEATTWNPSQNNVGNSYFSTLHINESVLYLGGNFSEINGQTRNNIAAFNLNTGALTNFNPNVNSTVNSIAAAGTTLFISGSFDKVNGSTRQNFAAIDKTNGTLTNLNIPRQSSGTITTLVASASTLYIGGNFTTINNKYQKYLAALDLNSMTLTNWAPNPDKPIKNLLIHNSTLYAIGGFENIGGQAIKLIAAFDMNTGNLKNWNREVSFDIYSLAVSGTKTLITGRFSDIGGVKRTHLAAINTRNDSLTNWNPSPDNVVYALAQKDSVIYVGGDFLNIGGQARNRIAALSITSGQALYWYPFNGADKAVRALAISGTSLYMGGDFRNVGNSARDYLAKCNLEPNLPPLANWNSNSNWNYNSPDGVVRAIVADNSMIYVGGAPYDANNSLSPSGLLAFDQATGDLTTAFWTYSSKPNVYSLALNGRTLYVAGNFSNIVGKNRNNIAAIDLNTGNVSSWNPNAGQISYTISVSGSKIYAGTAYFPIKKQAVNGIAAFNRYTGGIKNWEPSFWETAKPATVDIVKTQANKVYFGGNYIGYNGANNYALISFNPKTNTQIARQYINNSVLSISINGSKMYVGGMFTNIGGEYRNYIAALDTSLSVISNWNPNADNFVNAVYSDNQNVYLGGLFTKISNISRTYLASVDATSGNLTNWNPNLDNQVFAIERKGNELYIGGSFTVFNGQSRYSNASINISTNSLNSWNPLTNGSVYSISFNDSNAFYGGIRGYLGGEYRHNLAALDATTGKLRNWNPNVNSPNTDDYITTLAQNDSTLFVGGKFYYLGGAEKKNLASINKYTGSVNNWSPNIGDRIRSMLLNDSLLYISGDFSSIESQYRLFLAAINIKTNTVSNWLSQFQSPSFQHINQIIKYNDLLYVTGIFSQIYGERRDNVASFTLSNGSITSWVPRTNIARNTPNFFPWGSNVYTIGVTATQKNLDDGLLAISATTGVVNKLLLPAERWSENLTFNGPYLYYISKVKKNSLNTTATVLSCVEMSTGLLSKQSNPIIENYNEYVDRDAEPIVVRDKIFLTKRPLLTLKNPCWNHDAKINIMAEPNNCQQNTIKLKASTGVGNTYQWMNENGIITGANDSTYNATTNGLYRVTVTNSEGCNATSNDTPIKINQSTVIIPSSLTTFCSGDSVVLLTQNGTGLKFTWKDANGFIQGTNDTSFTVKNSGAYKVYSTNINSCIDSSNAVVITVNPLPNKLISSGSTTFCHGDSVKIKSVAGAGVCYQWKNESGLIAGATDSVYFAKISGLFKVVLRSSFGCVDSSVIVSTTKNNLPRASAYTSDSTSFCFGQSAVLKVNTEVGNFYQWKNETGLLTGATDSTYSAKTTGLYRVVITNFNGCKDSSLSIFVNVKPLPLFHLSFIDSAIFCQGDSVKLRAKSGSSYSYQWKNENGFIVKDNDSNFVTTTSGGYKAIATNEFGCKDSSSMVQIVIHALPKAIINPQNFIEICEKSYATINATHKLGQTYKWLKNAQLLPAETTSNFNVTNSGNYSLLVTDSLGCSDTSNIVTVTMKSLPITTIDLTSKTKICEGDSTLLKTHDGNTYSYQWLKNNNLVNGANSLSYFAKMEGTYKVIVTDTNNCSDTSQNIIISINQKPITSNILGDSQVNVNSFHSYSVALNPESTYQWMIKKGIIINGGTTNSVNVNWNTVGQGILELVEVNSSGCMSDTASLGVNVYFIDSLSLSGPDTLKISNSTPNQIILVNSNRSWIVSTASAWITPNKLSGFANDTILVSFSENKDSTLRLGVVTVTAGAISKQLYIVQDRYYVGIINHGLSEKIKIYPNPTTGVVYIENNENQNLNAVLYDLNGKDLQTFTVNMNSVKTFTFNNTASGIYVLKLTNSKGESVFLKIVLNQ